MRRRSLDANGGKGVQPAARPLVGAEAAAGDQIRRPPRFPARIQMEPPVEIRTRTEKGTAGTPGDPRAEIAAKPQILPSRRHRTRAQLHR